MAVGPGGGGVPGVFGGGAGGTGGGSGLGLAHVIAVQLAQLQQAQQSTAAISGGLTQLNTTVSNLLPQLKAMTAAIGNIGKGFQGFSPQIRQASQEVKEHTTVTKRLSDAFKVLKRDAKAAVNDVKKLAGGIMGVAKAAAAMSAGLIGAATPAIYIAANLEQQYITLGRVAGTTAKQTRAMAAALQEVAATHAGVTLDAINRTATFAARMGVGGAGGPEAMSKAVVGVARDLAELGVVLDDMDIEQAATSMVRILNVFHKGPEELKRFGASLVALDNASTATGAELLDMTTRLQGVGAALGASIPQLMGLAAAMRDAGLDVASGSTALSQLGMRLAGMPQVFSKAVHMSQAEAKALAQTVTRDPVAAIQMWLGALNKLAPAAKMQALREVHLTGRLSGQVLLQLSQRLGETSRYIDIANKEWSSMAALNKGVQQASRGTWAQLGLLRNQMELISNSIGQHLLPIVKGLISGLRELAEDALGGLKANSGVMEAWGWKAGQTLRYVGLLWKEWPTFVQLACEVVQEQVDRVIRVFKRLKENFGVLKSDVWGLLKNGATNTITVIKNLFTNLASFLVDLFGQVAANMGAQLQNAIASVGNMLAKIPGLGKLGGGAIVPVPGIKPKVDMFGLDKLLAGTKAWAGFRPLQDLFQGLPDRAKDIQPLIDKLVAARKAIDDLNISAGAKKAVRDFLDGLFYANRGGKGLRPAVSPKPSRAELTQMRRLRSHNRKVARMARAHQRFEATPAGKRRIAARKALGAAVAPARTLGRMAAAIAGLAGAGEKAARGVNLAVSGLAGGPLALAQGVGEMMRDRNKPGGAGAGAGGGPGAAGEGPALADFGRLGKFGLAEFFDRLQDSVLNAGKSDPQVEIAQETKNHSTLLDQIRQKADATAQATEDTKGLLGKILRDGIPIALGH